MPIALEYKSDHLLVRLVGGTTLSSLRRTIVVPYSDIRSVEVEAPRWPSMLKEWRIGTHFPDVVAHGVFIPWKGGRPRRFLHFNKGTQRVLTIHLEGHPDHDEISVEVRDPDAARKELSRLAGKA